MCKFTLATISRLPQYHQIFKEMDKQDREYVSSKNLSRLLDLDSSLVRKDLGELGTGVQKLGYDVAITLKKIEEILGLQNTKDAFLVGVGSLGQALTGYEEFKEHGVRIVGIFDNDEKKVGNKMENKEILSMSKFESLVKRMNIRIGIITVPEDHAQEVADKMIRAGIKAIWNFAPVSLQVDQDIIVRNENLASGLAILSYELERNDLR